MKVNIPPIKSQGIKTKLVPWIKSIVPKNFEGLWIEPFMGTGVVAFNIAPNHALLCDTNPHIVKFYSELAKGKITPDIVRNFLNKEGKKLLDKGEGYYYEVRGRFNRQHSPLDFLFLNRAGFNGMIRFNRKKELNTPFCRKPMRFIKSYITKIVNQTDYLVNLFKCKNFQFKCQSFEKTISETDKDDIIYCDPPYICRHVDYYNGWDEKQERALFSSLKNCKCRFILSTWHHNDYRENKYIRSLWSEFNILTREHFYHIGASEKNRNPIIEAVITNYEVLISEKIPEKNIGRLPLCINIPKNSRL